MALTIVVRSGDGESDPELSFDAPRIVLGRGESCDVRLPDASVSLRHASIQQRGSDYIIMDEGSTNGTFLDQVRLPPSAPRVLKSGQRVRVGRIWLEARLDPTATGTHSAIATKELALGMVARALADDGDDSVPRVAVIEGPDAGRSLPLAKFGRRYYIGRSPKSDLALSDADASRRHVELLCQGGKLFVRDLGSKNGVILDETTLTPNTRHVWQPHMRLEIGNNRFSYADPVGAALTALETVEDEPLRPSEVPSQPESSRAEHVTPSDATPAPAPTRAEPSYLPPPRAAAKGWGATDFLVALIALVVLGASVLALLWLIGSN